MMIIRSTIICANYRKCIFTISPRHKIKSSLSTKSYPTECSSTLLVDNLLSHTSTLLSSSQNLIAFSGGVDSSLVSSLVHRTSKTNISTAIAVMGVSNSLPEEQRKLAHDIANHIGIDLKEVMTNEGDDPTYIENKGQSCYICKSNLYSSINAISRHANSIANTNDVVLFNGTNKDDVSDATRVGLIAAQDYKVQSPLVNITKEQVRQASKHIGLPNWNYAASPCLRSRLAFGVQATSQHLMNVSKAELFIRNKLSLPNDVNFRVRVLANKRVRIELDDVVLHQSKHILTGDDVREYIHSLGFTGGIVDIREFKSGSVSRKIQDSGVRITETRFVDAA